MELLGGNPLQAAEQCVGGGVAAGQRHPQPAEIRAEEGEEPARARERKTQDRVQARVACDEAQS